MKIKVVIPNSGMSRETLAAREAMLSQAVSEEVMFSAECIELGPEAIESNTEEALAAVEVIRACIKAEEDGFDAVIIYCFSDLAIDAVRENVKIPVIGPGEVALAAAAMLSNRFTVITTTEENVTRTSRRLKRQGLIEKMTSIRALNIPVVELRESPEITKTYLDKVVCDAIAEEGIDGVVLACLGMAGYGREVGEKYGITVYDPSFLAAAFAENCIRTGLRHNRRNYSKYGRGEEHGLL